MKKILSFLCLALLASCNSGVENDEGTNLENNATSIDESIENGEINTNLSLSGREPIGDISAMLKKLPNIYMDNEDFKFCAVQNIDACIADFKFQNPDTTSCDDFITQDGIKMCRVTEITTKARQEESIGLCDSLESGADSCRSEVAMAIGLKSGNIDACDTLSDGYINECKNQIITSNAMKARDDSICDTLIISDNSFSYEKDFCKQEVEMQLENDKYEKQQLEEQERMQKEQEEQDAQMAEEEKKMAEQEAQ